ncbi:cupredoxin domain-containing protein [Halorussus salinisoli]|uniref:cupredoxin domain-containing protein n=1 Tax=Halorussus salinisoli TaxID=2558242 RepID=UPI0010C1740C|nr:plastocyanin/azurin family copper-binding protein [Halorussus salinisoli]
MRPPDEKEQATTDAERTDGSGSDTDAIARPANDAGDEGETVSRRAFVRAAGATAAAGAVAATGADEATAQAETYRFGGEVAAWQGREPSAIEGQSNPTIELEAGNEYEFWFENLDGQPHNIVIQDGDGNAIAESELVQEQGATGSITFTATPQMTQYICTVHPTTMVGDLEVTGELEGGQGGGLPFESLVLIAGLALAFVSPVLFALFLFSRRGGDGDEATVRR